MYTTCMFTCDKPISTDMISIPNSRLQMSVFTSADGSWLVPIRLAVSSHYASQGWLSLEGVATVAVVGDSRAQLELDAHPRPIAYHTRLETGLPGVLCGKR